MLAVSSPIPSGLLSPAFILGAVFGRLYGYAMRNLGLLIGIPLVKCIDIKIILILLYR